MNYDYSKAIIKKHNQVGAKGVTNLKKSLMLEGHILIDSVIAGRPGKDRNYEGKQRSSPHTRSLTTTNSMIHNPNSAKNQIVAASASKNIFLKELSKTEGNLVREKVIAKFAKDKSFDNFIWSNLAGDCAVCRDNHSWLLLDRFLQDTSFHLFFNKSDSPEVFCLANGSDLVAILHECSLDDFYIADENLTFFITYSHHDVLTASGVAKQWLEELTDGQGNLLQPLLISGLN
jgi:hypothetical protein